MKGIKKTGKAMYKVFEWLLTIAAAVMALYCVSCAVSKDNKDFYVFGYKPVVVLSGSMEPFMQTNSLVIVKSTKDIKENDVIMFSVDDETMVCHRAVEIDKEGNITTKGDNNETADFSKVSLDDVKGKVVMRMNFLTGVIEKFRQIF